MSREADIVIWDDQNFPRIPEAGHNLFFAESVRAVVEVKSHWSEAEWKDVKTKTDVTRKLIFAGAEGTIYDQLQHLSNRLSAYERGVGYNGFLKNPLPIGFAAVFLDGGTSCDLEKFAEDALEADDILPDIVLLLEPGIVLVKTEMENEEGHLQGVVECYKQRDDALMLFTLTLADLLGLRSVEPEGRIMLPEVFRIGPPQYEFIYPFLRHRVTHNQF